MRVRRGPGVPITFRLGFNPRTRESATGVADGFAADETSFNPRTRESATAQAWRALARAIVSIHALVRVRRFHRILSHEQREVSIHALVRVRQFPAAGPSR